MSLESSESSPLPPPPPVLTSEQKYCMDCGKVILRRAEICPGCGCRQIAVLAQRPAAQFQMPSVDTSQLTSPIAGQVVLLFLLNILWNGLGNLAVGDKRGWTMGFLNWVVFGISIFTAGIPSILFFGFCGYAGYQYLAAAESQTTTSNALSIR